MADTQDDTQTAGTQVEARKALLQAITKLAKNTSSATSVRNLAEAYAYTVHPNQSHGGNVEVSSK